jgi:hypothetical protein
MLAIKVWSRRFIVVILLVGMPVRPAVAFVGFGGQRYSGSGWAYLEKGLPVYRNVAASYYSYQDNSGGARATATGIPYNIDRPMVAVSLKALYDMGLYGLAYGDILLAEAPNNQLLLVAVADAGGLFAEQGSGRLLDLSPSAMRALGYPLSVGVIRGMTVRVVERICRPPVAGNKFPGCSQAQVAAQIAKVERLNAQGQLAQYRGNPLANAWGQLVADVGGALADILSAWRRLVQVTGERNRSVARDFEALLSVADPSAREELDRLAAQSHQDLLAVHIAAQRRYYARIPEFQPPPTASASQPVRPPDWSLLSQDATRLQGYISTVAGSN